MVVRPDEVLGNYPTTSPTAPYPSGSDVDIPVLCIGSVSKELHQED
jgi:hypothetical protein